MRLQLLDLCSPVQFSVPSLVVDGRPFNLSRYALVEFGFCGFVPFVKGGENVLGFTEGLKVAGQFTMSDERECPLHGTAIRLKIEYNVACAIAAEFAHFASELFPAFAEICFKRGDLFWRCVFGGTTFDPCFEAQKTA